MILIDADILVYRAISSVEHEIEWDEDVWTLYADLNEAHEAFEGMLETILRNVGSKLNYKLCFSDSANFRKDIDPTYKANRSKNRKPVGFKQFRQKIVEGYPSFSQPGLEADDCLGILATKFIDKGPIIVSDDKDLMQIPGKHLIDGEIVTVTKADGDYVHMLQTLTGDAVDGYSGCPGIGPKTAEKILAETPHWPAVVKAYVKAGLTEDDALRQARLARILQITDWDETDRKPILWRPTL